MSICSAILWRLPSRGVKGVAKRQGFTMVELAVATAVSAILTLTLVAVLVPVYGTYRRTLQRADAGLIAGNVVDELRSGTASALTVNATGTGLDIGRGVYGVENGILYFYDATYGVNKDPDKKAAVFDPAYYDGKTITLSTAQTGFNTAEVMVEVVEDSDVLYTLNATVSPLRNVLDSESRSTPAGMYETARAVISAAAASGGSTSAGINETLLNTVYNGKYPAYDRASILTDEQLTALIENSTFGTEIDYYQYLQEADPLYIATYVTSESLPVVYLTDDEKGASGDGMGQVLMVNFNNVWYVPYPIGDTRFITLFDQMSLAEISGELGDTNRWKTTGQLTMGLA